MDVFDLREHLTREYANYASSFIEIRDDRVREAVESSLSAGVYWPDPLIQLNPSFRPGATVDELVAQGVLHPECARIFRKGKDQGKNLPLQFHQHQLEAIRIADSDESYILTTGTGSGKSLAYIVPIVNHVLRNGSGKGIQAIVVYPMNALANSQENELRKFLQAGYPENGQPVTFARYTGQENDEQRQRILAHPPDILLTNYVMLELIMTRPRERHLVARAEGLRFLVLDELHTYRGRQGADVALLMRRVRDKLESEEQRVQYVGTSATLASEGSLKEQRAQIAAVGTQLFGVEVKPHCIIGETLQRATPGTDLSDPHFQEELINAIGDGTDLNVPRDYHAFVQHPLSRWIESVFGLEEKEDRLVRRVPRGTRGQDGAARVLAELTGLDEERCAQVIQQWLLAGYHCEPNPVTGFPPFAFRLHQFLSPAGTVHTTIEHEPTRYITLNGQQYVPGDRERVLFPLCFCRECGQEYYVVRRESVDGRHRFVSREFSDRLDDDSGEAGYLYVSQSNPWPTDLAEVITRLPDDWVEERNEVPRVRSHRRKQLPQYTSVLRDGVEDQDGEAIVYIPTPFSFCLNCGVAYASRQDDFGKLARLSSEGRSSATTILSLSAVLALKSSDLATEARKLLSFTDNRQDASLQAGHFNDFVEIGLLRGAIYRAALLAGEEGLRHESIAQQVFDALALPFEQYASDPSVRFQARQETEKALRQVLGYRIYRDLRRGWRVTAPNLEQCGLLCISYDSLDELAQAEDMWVSCHPALAQASPATRVRVARVLLDHMRRELAIKVDYLNPSYQERLQQLSSQRLRDPWAIDEDERMEYASVLFPRPAGHDDNQGHKFLSARGGFGMYLRRPTTFPEYRPRHQDRIDLVVTDAIIRQLLEVLRTAGLVEIIVEPKDSTEVPGYQLVASGMRWCAGSGETAFHDPIRVPRVPEEGPRPNPFFVHFYREMAQKLIGLEAREHTAQVPNEERQGREADFRTGRLPVLFCSPTMELGVDIAELNVVNMRNVPPTPANYAQRSGRAGRSGQPALVFTYCSSGSPHDQYFFQRPERMVSGQVTPPRLDLTNEDLLRGHIHAIWLAEVGVDLGSTLKDILDLSGENPSLRLLSHVRDGVENDTARERARERALRVLKTISGVKNTERLLEATMQTISQAFDQTCERWRGLYKAALSQAELQGRIIRDASRSADDKRQAERLRREAEAQLKLLTEIENFAQSDFYSYRYFATEGFLPGYSFPRLPISAFIPGRRVRQRDEFLSRPRFLAISEFGPRAIIYHEGSRYLINQVIMPVDEAQNENGPATTRIKQCGNCGYIHPISIEEDYDLCRRCNMPLDTPLHSLLRLQNVITKRRDRISSDEEERLRLGYEIRTGIQFGDEAGSGQILSAHARVGNEPIVALTYAQAATLWRINLGWARRKNRNQLGFVLDIERGYWARNEQNEDDPADPLSARTRRVIPYVQDKRNALLLEPALPLEHGQMASLQAALKRAIEATYQLEDNELAVEPLPSIFERRLLLFYEAAEGGAGVLRRLVDEPDALRQVAREALRLCHFEPDTGADLHRAENATEDCEAACYSCLLSYANQREHAQLDRHTIRDVLGYLAASSLAASPVKLSREDHFKELLTYCESSLESEWLTYLYERGYRLPDRSQVLFEACRTRPDFVYSSHYAVIYIDGSPHDYPERQARDAVQTGCMEDEGFVVVRFGYPQTWDATLARHAHIFGEAQ